MGKKVRDGAVDGLFDAVYFCFPGRSGLVGEMRRTVRVKGRRKGRGLEMGEVRPGVFLSCYPLKGSLRTS